MSRMKCPHGRIGRECFECYRELYYARGKQILTLASERDDLAREVSRLQRERIEHHAGRGG